MISHQYKCIFVHIPKTGGTSIEKILWPNVGRRTTEDLWMGFVDKYHNKYQTGGLQHLSASQIREAVGEDVFLPYFKFTLVRNPWDKAVSQYTYMSKREDLRYFIGQKENDSFIKYLELISLKKHVQWEPQINFVTDKEGNWLVDYVGKYESYTDSVKHIWDKLGVSTQNIPHENRGDHLPYQEYYNEETIQFVADLYAQDIQTFNYRFGS